METIKAVIYIRVSSEEQVKHGYSLQSQRERLIDYCKENRYQLINIYVDEGKSARSKLKNRKALLQLVEDAKRNKFNRIIIWRLDRWFRNIADYYKIQEILDEHHVDWECSDEEYNTTTSNGRLHLNIKLSIAQNESDQTSDRIKFNFENMVKNKRAIVGKQGLPLGYTISGEEKNKKVVKDKTTEHIVTDMWNNIQITGSIRQTMIYINSKYNLSICYDSMRHYFMNTKYYGCYRNITDYCPAYITKETFDKVQLLVKRNVKQNKRHDYIFSGLLRCPHCGRNMAGFCTKCTHKTKVSFYPGYRCNYRYQKRCDYSKRPVEKTLELRLLNNIQEYAQKEIIKIKSEEKKKERKIIDVNKLKKRLSRLTDLYLDEMIDRSKYDEEYKKINTLLSEAENSKIKENNSKAQLEALLTTNVLDIYNKLNNSSKRMFWANIINYIEVMDNDEIIVHFKE